MKRMVPLMAVVLLVGCASSSTNQSRAQAPASQEVVSGEARNRAKAHADLGYEYYAQKQMGTALQEAKVALKEDSSYTPAYNLLALIYMGLGETKSAEEAFQRALQLSPGDPEIANNYGWFLCQSKREKSALPYFDRALQNPLYPTPIVALSNAAECSLQIRDDKATEGYLKRALSMNPYSVRVLLLMASLKYRQKQYGEAHYYIAEANKYSEPTAAATILALRVARHTGNREEEARYLSLLRRKFPDSDEYKALMRGDSE